MIIYCIIFLLYNIIFYFDSNITTVGVSAATGAGISELLAKIELSAVEFTEVYLPELQRYLYIYWL